MFTHLCFLVASELREHGSDALALRVADCTQAITGVHPHHEPRDVGDDEPEASSANGTEPRPPWGMPLDFRREKLPVVV